MKLPATPFDQWRAWKGPHPKLPNTSLQVEAAWWKGRIVSARVLYPWEQKPDSPTPPGSRFEARNLWIPPLIAITAFFVVLMARRNWILERVDKVGAYHIALASFVLQGIAWAGGFHFVADFSMLSIFVGAVASALLGAFVLWFAYLALEPEVRARWPHSMVTWNRVLGGRWLDAQVGSHILIGATVGSGFWLIFKVVWIYFLKNNQPNSWDVGLQSLLGTRQWIGVQAANANDALSLGLFIFLTVFAMRQLLRNEFLAALAAAAMYTFSEGDVAGPGWWLVALLYGVLITGLIFVLLRFGLVATIIAVFFVNALNGITLGTDWNAWYVPASLASMLLLFGISVFAFWRSLGGRELIT